jgi:predicted PolB exonuclease-like 3'-5' exonuclease
MFDRPVAAFDIETIPDPDLGRRLLGLEGTDADVVHEMVRRRLAETDGTTEYPQLPWHRVVCVCVTTLDPASRNVEIRALGGELLDERSHVGGFFRFAERAPRLVSWNGGVSICRYFATAA